MRQSIRGYVDGLIARARSGAGGEHGGLDLPVLASEISAVRALLDTSEDLRRVLADPGVPADIRRGVLEDLLASRVGDPTMGLLRFTLGADRATETVNNITWLAARLEAAVQGRQPAGDGVLGHKAAEERVDGFATAILQTVQGEHDLGEVEDELFRFNRVVNGSDELSSALSSRDVPAEARGRLVGDLLQGKASPASAALAAYATQVGRPRDFEDLLGFIVDRVALESNRRLAEVRSAVELNDAQRRDLTSALTRAVGHQVEVRVTVDPSVVAGFVATIGDTVVDASAKHQLELLKERLVMPEVNITTGERH